MGINVGVGRGCAAVPDGGLLTTHLDSCNILKINVSTGGVSLFTGGAAGYPSYTPRPASTTALLFNAQYMAVSGSGTFAVISDDNNHAVQLINWTSPDTVTTEASTVVALAGPTNRVSGLVDGVGPSARFKYPRNIAMTRDGRAAFVCYGSNAALRRIEIPSGEVTTLFYNINCGGMDVSADDSKIMIFVDGRIREITDLTTPNQDPSTITSLAGGGSCPSILCPSGSAGCFACNDGLGTQVGFRGVYALSLTRDGQSLFIVQDGASAAIRVITMSTGYVATRARFPFGSTNPGMYGISVAWDMKTVFVSTPRQGHPSECV